MFSTFHVRAVRNNNNNGRAQENAVPLPPIYGSRRFPTSKFPKTYGNANGNAKIILVI